MRASYRILISRLCLAAFVIWIVALYVLSSIPKGLPPSIPIIIHPDKVLHFIYFMAGAFFFTKFGILKENSLSTRNRFLALWFLFAMIGVADEYHQSFTPGRSGNDPWDVLADILGAGVGIMTANIAHKIFSKNLITRPVSACDQDLRQ